MTLVIIAVHCEIGLNYGPYTINEISSFVIPRHHNIFLVGLFFGSQRQSIAYLLLIISYRKKETKKLAFFHIFNSKTEADEKFVDKKFILIGTPGLFTDGTATTIVFCACTEFSVPIYDLYLTGHCICGVLDRRSLVKLCNRTLTGVSMTPDYSFVWFSVVIGFADLLTVYFSGHLLQINNCNK